MVSELKTSCGQTVLVDDDVYEWARHLCWQICVRYVRTSWNINKRQVTSRIHHMVMGKPLGRLVVDHINGNFLDNRRCNLRIVTQSQNRANSRVRHDSKTGYTGVTYLPRDNRYRASVTYHGQVMWLGSYDTIEEAAVIRAKVELALFSDCSFLVRKYAASLKI